MAHRLPVAPRKRGGITRTFSEMIRGLDLPVRDLMQGMHLAYYTIQRNEENPSYLRLGDIFRLAKLMGEPVEVIMAELLVEINALPAHQHPLTCPSPPRKQRSAASASETQEV